MFASSGASRQRGSRAVIASCEVKRLGAVVRAQTRCGMSGEDGG